MAIHQLGLGKFIYTALVVRLQSPKPCSLVQNIGVIVGVGLLLLLSPLIGLYAAGAGWGSLERCLRDLFFYF